MRCASHCGERGPICSLNLWGEECGEENHAKGQDCRGWRFLECIFRDGIFRVHFFGVLEFAV